MSARLVHARLSGLTASATLSLLLGLILGIGAVEPSCSVERDKFDTESLFSFVIGTDIGDVGEKELESQTAVASGKGAGSYVAAFQHLSFEYTPAENLRTELSATAARHAISGIPDLDDVRRTSLQSISFEVRYRLLDREKVGWGLALRAEPSVNFIDETSGQAVEQYGSEFAVLVDREILPGTVTAFNFGYEPQVTREHGSGQWSRAAMLNLSTGLMTRVWSNFFLGAELRYLRAYDALDLGSFSGDAVYLGPALFYRPSEQWRISAGWSTQVSGHVACLGSALDLRDFSKNEVKVTIGSRF